MPYIYNITAISYFKGVDMMTDYERVKHEASNLMDAGLKRNQIRSFLFSESDKGKITDKEAVEILNDLDPEEGEPTF